MSPIVMVSGVSEPGVTRITIGGTARETREMQLLSPVPQEVNLWKIDCVGMVGLLLSLAAGSRREPLTEMVTEEFNGEAYRIARTALRMNFGSGRFLKAIWYVIAVTTLRVSTQITLRLVRTQITWQTCASVGVWL